MLELKLTSDKTKIADYAYPESDRLLYEAIYERLCKFDGKAKNAFAEPFYKPKSDGTQGPLVKTVKTYKSSTLNVELNKGKGVADNERRIRVDVFYVSEGKKKGYYLVPIYVADTLKTVLPKKAVKAHKSYEEWEEMKNEEFVFSLYPNDLIYVEHKNGIKFNLVNKNSTLPKELNVKKGYFYYRGMDIAAGAINIEDFDGVYQARGVGVKTLNCLRKGEIDILGNMRLIDRERRQCFRNMKRDRYKKA